MKIILILILLSGTQVFSQSKIYDVQMQSIDSSVINLNDSKAKKIFILSASPEKLTSRGLQFLDSLQEKFPSITFIALPAEEYKGDRYAENMAALQNASKNSVKVTTVSAVSKKAGAGQHPLMKYVTSAEENGHFSRDADTDFQMFLISESGILYAVLDEVVSSKTLDEVLRQKDVQE